MRGECILTRADWFWATCSVVSCACSDWYKTAAILKTPKISTNKAEKEGLRIRNPKEVSMMPKDMPNQGFLNK